MPLVITTPAGVYTLNAPSPGERSATLAHLAHRFQEEKGIEPGAESTQEFISIQERLGEFVKKNLFGADFDPFLVRAAQMNAVMASNAEANLFNINSLEFPAGHLPGLADAKKVAAEIRKLDLKEGPAALAYPGGVKFEANGRRAGAHLVIAQWQRGQAITVYPSELAIAPPIWPKQSP